MVIKKKILISAAVLLSLMLDHAVARSLFDESHYRSLVGDHHAYSVGESLTVLIYEQASAASSADTDTNKNLDIRGRVRGNYSDHEGGVELSNNFSGGGTVTRSGNLVASISVTVTEVLPSGEMTVSGKQWIQLNDEQQQIDVSGRVRPEDISVDNTVSSSRLADARIDYIGEGLLGGRQKPGIITRVFNWLF